MPLSARLNSRETFLEGQDLYPAPCEQAAMNLACLLVFDGMTVFLAALAETLGLDAALVVWWSRRMHAAIYALVVCLGLACPVPYRDYQPSFALSRIACVEQLQELRREYRGRELHAYCLREGGKEIVLSDGRVEYIGGAEVR